LIARLLTTSLSLIALVPLGCAELQLKRTINPAELAHRARGKLISAATDPSPLLRSHAIEALAESNQRSAIQFILAALNDEYWGVRFSACLAILEMRYEPAKALVAEKVKDPNRSVQAAAAGTAHILGDHRYMNVLGRTLFEKDVIVRRNTALVLGKMGESPAIRLLREVLRRDDDISVKLQATEAMAILGSKKAQRLMINYCRSTFDDEVILAMLALGRAKCDEARQAITYVYEQSSKPSRLGMQLVAVRALAMLGDNRGRKVALRALRYRRGEPQEAARIRKLAAMAIAEMRDPDNLPFLEPALEDPDPDVGIAAALAILKSIETE